jgi:hypothetical protein
MFRTKFVKKITIHILLESSVTFPPKIVPFKSYCEKCGRARQATDDNVTRDRKDTLCMMGN